MSERSKWWRWIFWAGIWSILITGSSLYIAAEFFSKDLFSTFFLEPIILLYNFIPIFLLLLFIAYAIGSLRGGVIFSALLWNGLAWAHGNKLLYRQEPLKVSDAQFLREAAIMAKSYTLKIEGRMILFSVLGLLLMVILTKPLSKKRLKPRLSTRFSMSMICFLLFFLYMEIGVSSYNTYMRLGTKTGLNQWQELNGFVSKGFSYPLLYTAYSGRGYVYQDYDPKRAEAFGEAYEDMDIPEKDKVHIMVVMLESFKDFYKYRNEKMVFSQNPYEDFYRLAADSIHGNVIVDNFGGGTIESETMFWSGYRHPPRMDRDRNTHVSYLRSQGYRTEAFHPSDGMFNNRHNIYPRVGFDEYLYFQNYFNKNKEDISPDGDILVDEKFFPRLVERFQEQTKGDRPYFSWSITYQGHGPYPDEYLTGNAWIKEKEGMDGKVLTAFNNYITSVNETSKNLHVLTDGLKDEEPTFLILFGDHSPSMGENGKGMEMLGINGDLSTEEGLINTYSTPYIIWANPAAREKFKQDFKGEGPTLELSMLMDYFYTRVGWKTTAYNQSMMDMMKNITVVKQALYREDGKWKTELSEKGKERWNEQQNYEFLKSREPVVEK